VRAGAEVSNDELVRFASLFNDELTLDNLDRVQLVSMCQLLSIPPFGTDGFLRNRLRSQLDGIKQVRQWTAGRCKQLLCCRWLAAAVEAGCLPHVFCECANVSVAARSWQSMVMSCFAQRAHFASKCLQACMLAENTAVVGAWVCMTCCQLFTMAAVYHRN
jgi:hypothetical protein